MNAVPLYFEGAKSLRSPHFAYCRRQHRGHYPVLKRENALSRSKRNHTYSKCTALCIRLSIGTLFPHRNIFLYFYCSSFFKKTQLLFTILSVMAGLYIPQAPPAPFLGCKFPLRANNSLRCLSRSQSQKGIRLLPVVVLFLDG